MSELIGNHGIQRKPLANPLVDLMGGAGRWDIKLHEHGFLALVDVMPRLVPEGQTGDSAIVQAARVSYGEGTKKMTKDRGLIRYLLRHRHTTPFEMVEFKFHVAMPVFVARQWVRHRTANINEYSARYSVMPGRFFRPTPEALRGQSLSNRQGRGEALDGGQADEFFRYLDHVEESHHKYERLVEGGVARELARIGLPLSTYTEWYWKCDLHNILHFIALRIDEHAQQEIRDYAQAMLALIRPIVPLTIEAFEDYRLGSMELTRLEVEALRQGEDLGSDNRRERQEWEAKRQILGLSSPR